VVVELQHQYQHQSIPQTEQLIQRLRVNAHDASWDWHQDNHKQIDRARKADCYFNHIIDLQKKYGIEMPLFEYEHTLCRALLMPGFLNANPKFH
jgi:hypothetical protein